MAELTIQLYPPRMQEFIAHWTQVNVALPVTVPPTPLVLRGGYTLANFTTDRAAIVAAIDAVIPAVNTQQGAITLRDQQKFLLKTKLTQFRAAVNAFLPDSKYVRMLPTLPNINSNESRFLAPFVDMSAIWNLINTEVNAGFTPPLLLPGAYTKALFDTDLATMRTAFLNVENAVVGASSARANRDVLLKPAGQRMKQYRAAVVARLPVGSPLLNNIPKYTVNDGPAAIPVNATIAWDAIQLKAVLTWQASASVDVAEYSIRTAPGPTYQGRNESVVASVPPTTLTFATDDGLTVPGSTMLFKIYTVTNTGREAGSRVLKIVRP